MNDLDIQFDHYDDENMKSKNSDEMAASISEIGLTYIKMF
jgi:hypothetical protein